MTDTKTLIEWADKHLMYTAKRAPVALVRGEGVRVWDSDGKEYLDFTGGIAVTALGHSHPKVVGTMREQAATLLHVSNLFYIPQQTQLAKLLCDHSFADRVFFSNSGAEANETAIKLARKWAKEHGASDRGDIITMRGGFHGRTLATVTATAQEKYHHGFEPLPGGFKYVPFNDLRAVERAIDSHTAAVMVEPIQGEGGINIPDDGYLPGPPQALRRGRHPAGGGRDPDRHGTHRPALGLRALRDRARHHDPGQGARQRGARSGPRSPPRAWRPRSRPAPTARRSAATRSSPRSG